MGKKQTKQAKKLQNSTKTYRPAGFFIRATATFIDGLLFWSLSAFIALIFQIVFNFDQELYLTQLKFQTISDQDMVVGLILYMIVIVINVLSIFMVYYLFYHFKSATPGKIICGLKVLRSDKDESIGAIGVIMREFVGKLISCILLFMGFFLVAIRSDKKGLHDFIAKTRVVAQR
ncbi:MAG: RDD family protein [Bacteriovoracaceae bacterium]|nr:RDD family protein [Bacteriovoracaceae bacterium]